MVSGRRAPLVIQLFSLFFAEKLRVAQVLDSDMIKLCIVKLSHSIKAQSVELDGLKFEMASRAQSTGVVETAGAGYDDRELRAQLAALEAALTNLAQNVQGFTEDDGTAEEEDDEDDRLEREALEQARPAPRKVSEAREEEEEEEKRCTRVCVSKRAPRWVNAYTSFAEGSRKKARNVSVRRRDRFEAAQAAQAAKHAEEQRARAAELEEHKREKDLAVSASAASLSRVESSLSLLARSSSSLSCAPLGVS